jgi:CheY-like chemotaxis protein
MNGSPSSEKPYISNQYLTPSLERLTDKAPKAIHILLAEDYAANILVATSFLEIFGYTFEVVKTGKEALEKLTQPHTFDIVLMDVEMPEINGFEATHLLREHEKKLGIPHIPVIGMTAHAFVGDRQRCMDSGMNDYISKPFDPDKLCDSLKKFSGNNTASIAIAKEMA